MAQIKFLHVDPKPALLQESAAPAELEATAHLCSTHASPVEAVIDPTAASDDGDSRLPAEASSKLYRFAEILADIREKGTSGPPEQVLAFSMWTDMLDLAAEVLEARG